MNLFAIIVMVAWIPLTLALFAVVPVRRAVVIALLFGWLFLPNVAFRFSGVPDYSKATAASYAVLLGILLFDAGRVFGLRWRPIDLPVLVWCLSPILSSLSNGLGLYDGGSAALNRMFITGVPYVVGRLYFGGAVELRELALTVLVAALIYVPLCLWEARMSPHLHEIVYGFKQHSFAQTKRFGGWRPLVFTQHGLALGMFMAMAALIGLWFWTSGAVRTLMRIPMGAVATVLLVTTVMCKSLGALVLLAVGHAVLVGSRWLRSPILAAGLLTVPAGYMLARTMGGWSGEHLVAAAETISVDRSRSLRSRLNSENVLIRKAEERPLLGWGGWSRSLALDDRGRRQGIQEARWVIAYGKNGLVGLLSLTAAVLVPGALFLQRRGVRTWSAAGVAPAAVFAVILVLHMCDNLLNAMNNPMFMMMAGGLGGFVTAPRRTVPPGVLA